MLPGFCHRSLKLRARGAVEFARQHLLFFAECYVSLAVKRYLNKAFSGKNANNDGWGNIPTVDASTANTIMMAQRFGDARSRVVNDTGPRSGVRMGPKSKKACSRL